MGHTIRRLGANKQAEAEAEHCTLTKTATIAYKVHEPTIDSAAEWWLD